MASSCKCFTAVLLLMALNSCTSTAEFNFKDCCKSPLYYPGLDSQIVHMHMYTNIH